MSNAINSMYVVLIFKENFDWQIDSWHFDEIIIGDFKECKQQVCDLVVKNKHRPRERNVLLKQRCIDNCLPAKVVL